MGIYVLKNSFVRGEASPLAAARSDIALHQQTAERLHNWLVLKEGGVTRRPGTLYIGETKHPNKDVRLVDFVFSTAQAYALEVGDRYVRFWSDRGQVVSGSLPYEIASPYAEEDLRSIQWVQENDLLYIARQSNAMKPQALRRAGHTSWSFADVDFIDGPYLPINDVNNVVRSDVAISTNTDVTFTFANTLNINKGAGFVATDVGRQFRVQFGGKWSWGVIKTVTSTTVVVVTIKDGNGGGGPGTDTLPPGGVHFTAPNPSVNSEPGSNNKSQYESLSWRLGAFSATTGYPGAVAFFQGRVVWGRTKENPRAFWYSRASFPTVMSPSDVDGTVTDSHGGMVELRGGRSDEILWMQEAPRMQIGTASGIRSFGASNVDEAFGPRNQHQRNEIGQGVSDVRPAIVGTSTMHAGSFGRSINDLFYDVQVQSLVAPEVSSVSDHLFKAQVREIVHQQVPLKLVWSLLSDGTMVSTTVERYEKVMGFTPSSLGGLVKSLCSIPGGGKDELYMVVRRTIGGVLRQCVEVLGDRYDGDTMDKGDAHYSDCGGVYTGVETNTVSGATWLAGATVSVLADGAVVPPTVVSAAGVLRLPAGMKASKIRFGLPYQSRGITLRAPSALPDGAALGRRCRVVSLVADLYQTAGLKFVSDTGEVEISRFRDPGAPMGSGPEPYTGEAELHIDGSWASGGKIEFVCDDPLPATVRAINIHLETA